MQERIVQFIRALRISGVRISLAESQDALFAVDMIGVTNPAQFRETLKASLVKQHSDQLIFDYYFPLFFSAGQPPLIDILDQLTPDEQEMVNESIRQLMEDMSSLQDLLQRLLNGQAFTDEELDQMGQASGLPRADEIYQRAWFERRMNRQAGLPQLERLLEQLLDMLQEMGMGQEQLGEMQEMLTENLQGLSEQISNYVGSTLANRMAQQDPPPKPDLSEVPLQRLNPQDMDGIRDEIRRLAAKLRSRASLRQKRAKVGVFDLRRTIRKNLQYGGVPMEITHKKRHKKPSLVIICDVSTSMRYCVEFLLTLVYELQDQIRRTHSYIFISDLVDISMEFEEHEPQTAIAKVMQENPPGYYSTDLGNSLKTFNKEHMNKIDERTTVIILGDGRNNFNDPQLGIAEDMKRRARRMIWFCPEPRSQWGTGDSDMWDYAEHADGVYYVNTLNDLADAIDQVLADA